jgi:hypothetical protein
MTLDSRMVGLALGLLWAGTTGCGAEMVSPGADAAIGTDAFVALDGAVAQDTARPGDAGHTAGSTLGHPRDPIALDGNQLPGLGDGTLALDRIVAFRWDGAAFTEVTIQIDPRQVRPFSDALSPADHRVPATRDWSTSFYTDSNAAGGTGQTYVRSDTVVAFDHDDELVVMAADLGGRAPALEVPDGARANSRLEVHAYDANDASREGYLYLFERSGAAGPAPTARVDMNVVFVGQSGDFTTFFDSDRQLSDMPHARGCGDNHGWGVVFPENTTITTAGYTRHFSGRWLSDGMRVAGASALGPDVLDIHESRPVWPAWTGTVPTSRATIDTSADRTCTRSVTSYSGAAGTYVTLREGPLRAIRAYYGSNSGTINERTHVFYEGREDVLSYVRVHPIPGISEGLDLSSDAMGMRYYNSQNRAGLDIDGVPDVFDRTLATWEMVTGATQNTVLSVHRTPRAELGPMTSAYVPQMFFIDDGGALTCVCSGDAVMIGAHGVALRTSGINLPNTDPRLPTPGVLTTVRTLYGLPGTTTVETADAMSADAFSIRVTVDDGSGPGAEIDPYTASCGDDVCEQDETSVNCLADCPIPPGAETCGNGTCGGFEPFVCLADCVTPHQDWFVCANAMCASDYAPCVGDPECQSGLATLSMCTGTYATCVMSTRTTISDAGSSGLFNGLTSRCSATCSSAW